MPDNKLYRMLRVFVSSPSDVGPERARLDTVIKEDLQWMANELGIMLEMLDWPNVAPGAGRPEQVILDKYQPKTWDVFIGIMWQRFGTPPQSFNAGAAEYFYGGTEEEFKAAYVLWKQNRQPRVMFYRCNRGVSPDAVDIKQLERVQKFFKGFSPQGKHPGFYQTYTEAGDFERAVRRHLGQVIFEYWRDFTASEHAERMASDGAAGKAAKKLSKKSAKKSPKKSGKKSSKRSSKNSTASPKSGGKNRKR